MGNLENNYGGKREGAGRPKTDIETKTFTFRAPMDIANLIDHQANKSDFIKECIVTSRLQEIFKNDTVVPATETADLTLPFFDINVVAGFPVPLDNDEKAQDINILRLLCPHPESCYLIRVEGESMIEADIHSGDILIVDKSKRNPSESEVAVCELNGEYTIKRFVKRDGCGWLVPANPKFPEIKVTESDTFNVWGTVTYIIHKPRE